MLRTSIRSFSNSASRNAFARIQILGSVGQVQARETRDGAKFLTYSLAVNRFSPTAEDNKQTDWFNISVFNESQVSSMEKFLKPGVQLLVEADVSQRVLEDEKKVTNYKQNKFDVVKFAKRDVDPEAEEESA